MEGTVTIPILYVLGDFLSFFFLLLLFPSDLLFSFFYGAFWVLLVFYVSFFFLSFVFISYDFCKILQAFNCKEPPRLSAVSTWCLYVFILFLFSSGFSRASVSFSYSLLCLFSVSYVYLCLASMLFNLFAVHCFFQSVPYLRSEFWWIFFLYPCWLVQLLYPSSISWIWLR